MAVKRQQSGSDAPRRRGIRTTILSLVSLAVLLAAVIGVLIASLGPPSGSAPATPVAGSSSGAGGPSSGDESQPGISGRISLAADLAGRVGAAHVLFIIARRGPGPPFAVKRIVEPRFPLRYRLGPENAMMAGAPFEGEVSVAARLSLGGGAGQAQPGDMQGEHPGKVAVGARGVDIVIDHVD